jgi:hypothetical protein
MITLPVSGIGVEVRAPCGAEDVLLLEARTLDAGLALELLARLARPAGDADVQWGELAVTDLDALLLGLRQELFEDWIRTDTSCPSEGCGARIDVFFRISEYLAHHRPRAARSAVPTKEEGWYRLRDAPVSFRLPRADDLADVVGSEAPERALIVRCVRPAEISRALLRRVERAMQALAPSLVDDVQGICPECGVEVDLCFDPQHFTLRELRDQASLVYEDVHLLAYHYHWSQDDILALPRRCRTRYADLIRRERSLA